MVAIMTIMVLVMLYVQCAVIVIIVSIVGSAKIVLIVKTALNALEL